MSKKENTHSSTKPSRTAFSQFKWMLFPIAGGMQTLSLSPFDWWPLGILSITILMYGVSQSSPKKALLAGWLFGAGLFGSGVSWIYVSINDFGYAPAPLAATLTALFVAAIAFFPASTLWLYKKIFNHTNHWSVLIFPAIWVLGDWFRSWFLTGFPWLYLGYGHVDTALAGWATIAGVHGVTFVCALTGSAIWYGLTQLQSTKQNKPLVKRLSLISYTGIIVVVWGLGAIATHSNWSDRKSDTPISIAAVQGNIPQELKWNNDYRLTTIEIYQELSTTHWGKQLVIWPETAIPILYNQARPIITRLSEQASAQGSTLIFGVPYGEKQPNSDRLTIHNSIVSTGQGDEIYHKQKLVPFGEYVPMEQYLRGVIQFFDLPMSSFSEGAKNQPLLKESTRSVAPYICYEIVYPDFVAERAQHADYLLTISNDSWFGKSIGPLQHLQMAQMRGLENARYVVRATNNGISAIINPKGEILQQSEQFVRTVMTGEIYAMEGQTPFNRLGSTPILLLCVIMLTTRRLWLYFRVSRPS